MPNEQKNQDDLLTVIALIRSAIESKDFDEVNARMGALLTGKTVTELVELIWLTADVAGMILEDVLSSIPGLAEQLDSIPTAPQVLDQLVSLILQGKLRLSNELNDDSGP